MRRIPAIWFFLSGAKQRPFVDSSKAKGSVFVRKWKELYVPRPALPAAARNSLFKILHDSIFLANNH
jgi:hypothetical protein